MRSLLTDSYVFMHYQNVVAVVKEEFTSHISSTEGKEMNNMAGGVRAQEAAERRRILMAGQTSQLGYTSQ